MSPQRIGVNTPQGISPQHKEQKLTGHEPSTYWSKYPPGHKPSADEYANGLTTYNLEHLRHFIRLDFLTTSSYNSCTIHSKEDCISYHSYWKDNSNTSKLHNYIKAQFKT